MIPWNQAVAPGPEPLSHAAGQGEVAGFRFSTADNDAPFAAWRSVLATLFEATQPQQIPPTGFKADLLVQHFGTFLLCRSFAGSGRFLRDHRRVCSDDLDHVVVSSVLSGGIAIGGKARRLRPGDVTVVDLSSPMRFAMVAADALHLIVPRAGLPSAVASLSPMPCRVFHGDTAMAIFLRGILESLSNASRYFSELEVNALGACFPDLLGWCLGTVPVVSSVKTRGDLGRRLRRHIEENIDRADLTASRLAREIGVSRSQLYRQFEASGGVDTYIRGRRLRRSLQALADPRRADARIADISYEMGFPDEAHFSRLFRQTFGQSPRDIRAAARAGDSGLNGLKFPPGPVPSFSDWLLMLGTG